MRYHALACDYDGTIATNGRVNPETINALERLKASGRKLILVTGRQLDDLLEVFPSSTNFDRIVAENGALVFDPATREEHLLSTPPAEEFINRLTQKHVTPLSIGKIIVATQVPNETIVLDVIRELGLDFRVIYNKGAVMILPSGINKATGLKAALDQLSLSLRSVVGVGDAENDHAFLTTCGWAVAVANAIESLKKQVNFTTRADNGAGVAELIDMLLNNEGAAKNLDAPPEAGD